MNLLIKSVSGNCNMHCIYCFYDDATENRKGKNYGMMSYETLAKKAFEYAENMVGFEFQGGEPTLTGLDFYKHLISLNAIQTNGMLIDDEWAEFLAKNKFLVGLSRSIIG